jgi:hypothetical protein
MADRSSGSDQCGVGSFLLSHGFGDIVGNSMWQQAA